MSDSEHVALEHIRRVIDSVIGEPAPVTTTQPAATVPAAANILPVPYVSQLGAGADQFTHDSGAAAGAMLIRAFTDKVITPDAFFTQTGQHADLPLSFTQIANTLSANGVVVELRGAMKLADLALILSSTRPALIMVKQTVLQQAGLTPETYTGPHYMVAVGLDVKYVYVHDPLRKDVSGQAQPIPWITLYQAWSLGQGYERAGLVPRQQLIRRVKVTAATLNARQQPNANATITGLVHLGDSFEITIQKDGWGKINDISWINLAYTMDV
jgi:hypothetical protein